MKKLLLCLPVLLASVCWSQTTATIPLTNSSCHKTLDIATLSGTWSGPVTGGTCTIPKSTNLSGGTCIVGGNPAQMTSAKKCKPSLGCCYWWQYYPLAHVLVDVTSGNPPTCDLDISNNYPFDTIYECDWC